MSKVRTVKQSRILVDSYLRITADHSDWTDKQIAAYMVSTHAFLTEVDRFGHQDVGRLRRLAEAPAAVRQLFYDEKITAATLDTILNCSQARYLEDQDKIILAQKAAANLLGGSGAPHIRKVIHLVLQSTGFRSKWADPELAWTYEDLLVAKLDQDAMFDRRRKDNAEFMDGLKSSVKIDYGLRTQKWIKQMLEVDLPHVWEELPDVMALTFQASQAAEDLEEVSLSLWLLAQRIKARGGLDAHLEPLPALALHEVIDAATGVTVLSTDGAHEIHIAPTPPEEIESWHRAGSQSRPRAS